MDEQNTESWTWPRLDTDGDGAVTAGDFAEWVWQLLFVPGDAALGALLAYAPGVADMLALDAGDYGGAVTGFFSLVFWFVAVAVAGVAAELIRDFDRILTAYCVAAGQGTARHLRVARRRLANRVDEFLDSGAAGDGAVMVAGVALGDPAAAVLRFYGQNGGQVGGRGVVMASDAAAELRLPVAQIEAALRTLIEQRMIVRSFGTDEGREGHHITQAGQIYLLEH